MPEPLHEHALAVGHWRTDADTDDMRHIAEKIGRSPSSDQHVAFDGKLENLLGRISRHARPVDAPALEQGSLASKKALHLALAHACAARDILRDEFMVHDIEAQPFGEARRDVPAERRHLTGHCDDRHDVLSEASFVSVQGASQCSRMWRSQFRLPGRS